MPEYANWSLDEEKRFWLALAHEVIQHWRLGAVHLDWLGYSGNAVFKVGAPGGSYVLRMHLPGRVRADYLASELSWLRYLRAHTSLLAPVPLPLPGNESDALYYAHRLAPQEPDVVLCCLFEYLAGESKPAQDLSSADLYALGIYLGTLHQDGQFEAPSGFARPKMQAETMFGAGSLYAIRDASIALTAQQADIFERVQTRLRAEMAGIARNSSSFGLIHGDLLAKNILFRAGTPVALDFEYCAWAFFLYDLAPILWQLKGERPGDYPQLEEALWRGYTAKTGIDMRARDRLEVFIAARQLASCRWLLAHAAHPEMRALAPRLLADRTQELRGYLETGLLQRRSLTL